jgi:hypothetical protein
MYFYGQTAEKNRFSKAVIPPEIFQGQKIDFFHPFPLKSRFLPP